MIFLTARGLYGVGDTICVSPLDGIEEDDLIENISAQPRIHISDCRFGKAISHLRIQSRGEVLFENNEIGLPLLFTGDTNYWFEASPAQNATVRNNHFIGRRGLVRLWPEYEASETAPYLNEITSENITSEGKRL